MKRYLYITTVSLLMLAFTACDTDEFLDITPVNSNTPLGFYETEKQINEAVIAIYNQNRDINNGQWRFGEFRSDNTYYQRNEADRGGFGTEEIDEFMMNSDNGNIASYWNSWYRGVLLTNVVLQNIDEVTFAQVPENKDFRRAEALFFRAWFYFNLARSFGDVPFVESIATDPEGALDGEFTGRVPVAQVYQRILEDVQTAIDLLPQAWPGEVGRATQGAALMLKAKVHMTLQEYSEAIPLLRQMESLGYTILDNFEQVFNPANKNHTESVFEIQFSFDNGQASNFLSQFVPFTSRNRILLFNNASSRAGLNQPTQELIDLFPAGDARADVSIAYDEGVPFMGKYNYAPLAPNRQDVNFPMFRYADARLMLAECLAETGSWMDGIAIINNEIRPRTGVADPVMATDQQDALAKIGVERRLELAFENHRWFDLVRRGEAEAVMLAHGQALLAERPFLTQGEEYTNIRTILGIPFVQVEQFGYTQNPGW